MSPQLKQEIVNQANLDAISHQKEFPGEPIKGDWDSEAFSELRLPMSKVDAAWPIYYKALRSAVKAMIGA
jgi:hypothetical protein